MTPTARRIHTTVALAVFALIAALLCMALTGCASAQDWRHPVIAKTNLVATVTHVAAVTNSTQQVGPDNIVRVVEQVTPEHDTTNWNSVVSFDPNPAWVNLIQGAKTVNASVNPTPSEPIINAGLAAVGGLLSIFAAWKTRQAAKHGGALGSVIAAVETIADPNVRAQVKEHIETISAAMGHGEHLDNEVRNRTP